MSLVEEHDHRELDEPVLVVGLEGWIDAGLGAHGAVAALATARPTELAVSFADEDLIDQRARRPMVRLVDGVNEGLAWPAIQLRLTKDLSGSDVALLVGPEPDFRWPTFVAATVQLARTLGVRMAVGLGAFPAPAPHTRAIKVAGTAPPASADLVTRVGLVPGSIEVPAGIWSALELGFGEAGIPAVGLWARVPHYVSGTAYPAASAALLDALHDVSGLSYDTTVLRTAGDEVARQVDDLISRSQEHGAMVRTIEENIDAAEGNPLQVGQLPTADELAAELERYLRNDGEEGPIERS